MLYKVNLGKDSKTRVTGIVRIIKRRTIQPFIMVKYGPKKVPQSARLSAGGSNRYLGNAQM